MLAAIVSPWIAGTRDAFFRFDVRVRNVLVQCHRGGNLEFKDLFEEVDTVSWDKEV